MMIENFANQILEKHKGVLNPPLIDVNKIAEKEGIKIHEKNFKNNISAILIYKDGQFNIGIEKEHDEKQKRFLIAHELGHYFLQRSMVDLLSGDPENIIAMFRDGGDLRTNKHEINANLFAIFLLLPAKNFKEFHKKENAVISELAKIFNVSEALVTYRCEQLNLDVPITRHDNETVDEKREN